MLTMREAGPEGFGAKVRGWNATTLLQHWREAWATHVNEHCAAFGIDARIDHRSYEAQGIALEPQHKIGAARARRDAKGEVTERAADHRAIAGTNGVANIRHPSVAQGVLHPNQHTFTLPHPPIFTRKSAVK